MHVIGFAVDQVIGQQTDGAVGLLGIVALEDRIISVAQFHAAAHQLRDFVGQKEQRRLSLPDAPVAVENDHPGETGHTKGRVFNAAFDAQPEVAFPAGCARVLGAGEGAGHGLGARHRLVGHHLVEQYAEIFDALPPIEINQDKEIIDGWHRYLAARCVDVAEITCVVIQTTGDDDLADRMWEANRKHGVQYSRGQRKAYGVKLHGRGLSAKEIAERAGVGVNTVYRWTKGLREEERRIRDERILELADTDMSLRQIADEVGVDDKTVGNILRKNAQMREIPHDDTSLETLETIGVAPDAPLDDVAPDIPDSE